MMAGGLALDGYVRVSKVGGRAGDGFISPDVQAEAITAWAESRGHKITLHEPELDVSGGTMDRPVFGRIMERIDSGESQGLIVYRVDRFARSLLGALTTLETIAKAGGSFASVKDDVDMTTPAGRAFLNLQLVMAQLFREQVTEGFDVATSRAVARGVHIANQVPAGYDRIDQRLVPNDAAPVIGELFARRAAGEGHSSLARWMDEVLPRPDGQRWIPARIRHMLSMRVYLGEASYGRHVNPDAHEPLVSLDVFQRAESVRAPSTSRSGKAHLLAGLLRCAGCRYLMTPSKSGAGGGTATYRCRGTHTTGPCPAPSTIVRTKIEDYVNAQVRELLAGELLEGLPPGEAAATATLRLDELRAELERFAADTDAHALLGDEAWKRALTARVVAVEESEREVAALTSRTIGPASVDVETWDTLTVDERRLALSEMLDVVFVRKLPGKAPVERRALILWRNDGPDDLPRRGCANGPVRGFTWPEDESGVTSSKD